MRLGVLRACPTAPSLRIYAVSLLCIPSLGEPLHYLLRIVRAHALTSYLVRASVHVSPAGVLASAFTSSPISLHDAQVYRCIRQPGPPHSPARAVPESCSSATSTLRVLFSAPANTHCRTLHCAVRAVRLCRPASGDQVFGMPCLPRPPRPSRAAAIALSLSQTENAPPGLPCTRYAAHLPPCRRRRQIHASRRSAPQPESARGSMDTARCRRRCST